MAGIYWGEGKTNQEELLKRLALFVAMSAMLVAVPAWAAKPTDKPAHPAHPTHPAHPAHPAHPSKGPKGQHGKKCDVKNHGYRASGSLVSATLTPATKKHHFDGTLTVDVTRANHKATLGSQTFTLTNARVFFGKGVSSTAPAAGDHVVVHGKITALPHGCSTTGFTPAVTVKSARISMPKSH